MSLGGSDNGRTNRRSGWWKPGIGIYVAGHDFGKGDIVEIEGTAHEVTDMRPMEMHGEAVTLIVKASELSEPSRSLLYWLSVRERREDEGGS